MLSTSMIKNVGQASHYFAASDNYYTKEEGHEQSEWYGKGASRLNLQGHVNPEQFLSLLEGRFLTGEQLGKVVDGSLKHRPGWDLTFSAPKSVSVMALVGGDTRLVQAHREAVAVALSHVEQSCSEARIRTPNGMVYQNTNNIVAALYHHDLSRAQDPQLHTHSVVMNMTQRTDGKWRSQASQLGRYDKETQTEVHGFIERVRNNKRYFGKIYETELALRVKQLGYEITNPSKRSVFEIADVPPEVNHHFSKRRSTIEAYMEQTGFTGGKAADVATLHTREAKKTTDREELNHSWREEAKNRGLDCEAVIQQSIEKLKFTSKDLEAHSVATNKTALALIQASIKELSVFKTAFTLEELVTDAAQGAIYEKVNIKKLTRAVDSAVMNGSLILLPSEKGKTRFIAQESLDQEANVSRQLKEHPMLAAFRVSSNQVNHYVAQHEELPLEMSAHLNAIFDKEKYILLEGHQTKEQLIKPILEICKSASIRVGIISPNQVTSKKLSATLTPKPQGFWEHLKAFFMDTTIQHEGMMSFLASDTTKNMPDVLLVDNANLLSTYQLSTLFDKASHHDTKIILLGNKDTLLSQQRNLSLQKLIENGIKTIQLSNEKSAFIDNKAEIKDRIEKAKDRFIEVSQSDERLHAMATHFSRLKKAEQQASFLVAHTNSTVDELNQRVHDALKKNGQVGDSIDVNVLIPVFFSESKAKLAASYQKNHYVRFNDTYKSIGVDRGDYLKIVSTDKSLNKVILENKQGKKMAWRPDKVGGLQAGKVELFREETRELSVGERIVFKRSFRNAHIVKGEQCYIQAIQGHHIQLGTKNGKPFWVDLLKETHRHIDYGYASTPHAIAHEKADLIIADLPAQHFMTDQRRFFQILSQPDKCWIYTDNLQKISITLKNKTGNQLSAHEIKVAAEERKKNFHSFYDVLEKQLAHTHILSRAALSKKAVEAVDYAMSHLAERSAGFSHKELLFTAMNHALGNVSQEELTHAAIAMEKAGVLLRGDRSDGTLWTTAEAVKIEREILLLTTKDQGTLNPIVKDFHLPDSDKLSLEQVEAVKRIAQSSDRVMAVQGYAGTGKTTMLTMVSTVINQEGYELLGLAPTHTAVKELRERGIKAQTLDSFILEIRGKDFSSENSTKSFTHQLLVLDESSMVSNRKMLDILRITHDLNFRGLIVTGDVRQLPAIEAGKSQQLVQTAIEPIYLKDIRRQNDPVLKKAVKQVVDYDFQSAFTTLKNSIIEIGQRGDGSHASQDRNSDRIERISTLVNDYFAYSKDKRDTIQVITPGHDDRALTNALIRSHLKEEGSLYGQEHALSILTSTSMTQVERSSITNFEVGQILRFNQSQSSQIKTGEYFSIVEVDRNHHLLTLKNSEGKEVVWEIPRAHQRYSQVEVYQREHRTLQVGDKIRWSKTDKVNELLSSELACVTRINGSNVTVQLANKKMFTFNSQHPHFQHWDHGYASTVYAVQGNTKSIVLAHLESFRENLTTQPAFLVALTRAQDVFKIYTDNAQSLLSKIQKNAGVKLSSLEVIGEYPEAKRKSKNSQKTRKAQSISANVSKPTFDKYTIDRIKEGLNQNAEKIAIELLGKPKVRGSHYLKFGSHQGSLSVTTKGSKQGYWNDFSAKGGRSMLSFLQINGRMSRQEALQFGARWLGIQADIGQSASLHAPINATKKRVEKNTQPLAEAFNIEKRKIAFARELATQSLPARGTIVEKYLQNHRGISMGTLPADIRFHPGIYSKLNGATLPAMLVIARDHAGKVQAVQATYLDEKTADKVNKERVAIQKQTFGVLQGATVNIHDKKGAPTLIAEGIETGLSLANCIDNVSVKVTLGKSNLLHFPNQSDAQKIIFCLDNDGKNLQEDKIILEAANRQVRQGKEVAFMVPTALGNSKQDYNDVIKQDPKFIKKDYSDAISYTDFYKIGDAKSVSVNTKIAPVKTSELSKAASIKDQNYSTKNIQKEHEMDL